MTTRPRSSRTALVEYAAERLSFLERIGARVQVLPVAGDASRLDYVLPSVTFEMEFDWHEQAAFLLVCRTEAGGAPGGYYVHDGAVVRVHVLEALRKLGLFDPDRSRSIKTVMARSGPEAMRQQIDAYAELLQGTVGELANRASSLFPPTSEDS